MWDKGIGKEGEERIMACGERVEVSVVGTIWCTLWERRCGLGPHRPNRGPQGQHFKDSDATLFLLPTSFFSNLLSFSCVFLPAKDVKKKLILLLRTYLWFVLFFPSNVQSIWIWSTDASLPVYVRDVKKSLMCWVVKGIFIEGPHKDSIFKHLQ